MVPSRPLIRQTRRSTTATEADYLDSQFPEKMRATRLITVAGSY